MSDTVKLRDLTENELAELKEGFRATLTERAKWEVVRLLLDLLDYQHSEDILTVTDDDAEVYTIKGCDYKIVYDCADDNPQWKLMES